MANSRQTIQVLQAFQPFRRFLTIFNADNFREKDPNLLIRNIFTAICQLLLYSILAVSYISDGLYCYENSFDMRMAAQQIAVFFVCIQIFATYLSIFRKRDLVNSSIQTLQKFVDERKMLVLVEKLRKVIKSSFVKKSTGCKESRKSFNTYKLIEKRFASVVSMIIKFSFVSCCFLFGYPALQPITFAMFKCPSPDHWTLPFGFQ